MKCALRNKKWNDPLQIKSWLFLWDVAHAIDYIMRENDLTDTEYRAYIMQSMYQIAISFIDDVIASKHTIERARVEWRSKKIDL